MEADLLFSCISILHFYLAFQFDLAIFLDFILLIILITCSGLISSSEVAFFSFSPTNIRTLEEEDSATSIRMLKLYNHPKRLLATILIANNFVNIAIIIVSQVIINQMLNDAVLNTIGWWMHENIFLGLFSPEQIATGVNFFITVVFVTFILLLLGEVGPKIYANTHNMKVARFMSAPLSFLSFLFSPVSGILVGWGNRIHNKINSTRNYQTGTSKEDLDAAIDLTVNRNIASENNDAELLKGIVKFGDMSTRQIMKPRVDIIAIEKDIDFNQLLEIVRESGYSRLPVYDDDFDNIIGILYVKDLIGHTDESVSFHWQQFIRTNMLYVPETKKIDDLLRDFQIKKLHMAIVVDEFGGTLGIVTLDDIMEEVIGEIKDEFDGEEESTYIKLGEGNFIFEGKTLLNDVCRILGEKTSYFDDVKGSADSIGGLAVEITGIIPKPDKEIAIKSLKLKIISSNSRRVEKVNVRVINDLKNNDN